MDARWAAVGAPAAPGCGCHGQAALTALAHAPGHTLAKAPPEQEQGVNDPLLPSLFEELSRAPRPQRCIASAPVLGAIRRLEFR